MFKVGDRVVLRDDECNRTDWPGSRGLIGTVGVVVVARNSLDDTYLVQWEGLLNACFANRIDPAPIPENERAVVAYIQQELRNE